MRQSLTRRSNLETPFLAEEQSQGADVCVLLMSNVLVSHWIRWDVVHHCQGASGRAVVSVAIFEPCITGEP